MDQCVILENIRVSLGSGYITHTGLFMGEMYNFQFPLNSLSLSVCFLNLVIGIVQFLLGRIVIKWIFTQNGCCSILEIQGVSV